MGIIRETKSVRALIDIFGQQKDAISVVDLVARMQQQMNKTTVYRILERLEDEGTLHSFTCKDGRKWYARCKACSSLHHVDSHPHFQCCVCSKMECIAGDISVPSVPNHQIDTANLLLTGLCEDCLQ
jgi:Fur family ferric uptake transcriptional regulator